MDGKGGDHLPGERLGPGCPGTGWTVNAGGMAERTKAMVLKTIVAHQVTVGSNPTPSATLD